MSFLFDSYIDNFDVHSQRQAEMANKKTVLIKKDGAISAVPPLFMHGLRRPSLDMRKIISPHGNGWQPSQSTHRFCGFGVMLRNVFTVQRMHLSAERLLSVLRLFCAGYWFPSSLYPILFFTKDMLWTECLSYIFVNMKNYIMLLKICQGNDEKTLRWKWILRSQPMVGPEIPCFTCRNQAKQFYI